MFSAVFQILFITLSFSVLPLLGDNEKSPRALVHLLDYLARDYGGAVSDDGKIINQTEYKEQLEFCRSAKDINSNLEFTKNNREITSKLQELNNLISHRAPSEKVSRRAQELKALIVKIAGIEVAPLRWPNLKNGHNLFQKNCATCHGEAGDGNGPAAISLNPKPISFFNDKAMAGLSPFHAFNAIRLGVQGTAMPAFAAFTDTEIWNLSFYVFSIRHKDENVSDVQSDQYDPKSLLQTATLSDEELLKKISKKQIAYLRTRSVNEDFQNTLQIARNLLKDAEFEYQRGNLNIAKHKALLAYLEGIEPIEPRLKASDPSANSELERRMLSVREAIEEKSTLSELTAALTSANLQIDYADTLINKGSPNPLLTFIIASAIILREGFEAVLIIIALLGVIKATGSSRVALWVHGGWLFALGCGVVAWFFSGWIMAISGAQREMMEAVTSILSVLVLLYMGFWLHSKTEIGRWRSFIDGQIAAALKKSNLFALSLISFTAVFREAFETVLFLRALWLEGGMASRTAMAFGVFGTLVLIIFLAWLLLRFTTQIPIRRLFDYSSLVMAVLAIILTGKAMHSFQETGMLNITNSPLALRLDWMGLYPTLETTLSQATILVLIFVLWNYGKRPSHSRA